MSQNFYNVLDVPTNASAAQIRVAYHKIVIKLHPDKTGEEYDKDLLHAVQAAWETLRDPVKRQEYDERLSLMLSEIRTCIYDEVKLSEMNNSEDDDTSFSLDCRCGGEFFVSKEDLEAGFNLIPCSNCSAKILITTTRH
jgi:diphthamide biosynthesis protein 4